MYEQLSAEKKQ